MAASHNEDREELEGVTAGPIQHKEIQDTETRLAAPQPIDNVEKAATYTIEVQTVADTTSKNRLPSTSIHVLEEISTEPHVDGKCVEHDDTQGTTAVFSEGHVTPSLAHQSHHVANASNDHIEVTITSQVPNAQPEVHTSKNIQNDLELWARIREYDQRTAAEGITQVLSKKQQLTMKKQVLGKPHYKTRAKGGPPPSSQ